MPYESKAQQRKFHAMEARGEIAHSTVKEYDEATKGMYKKLPEHKGAKHNTKIDEGSAGAKAEEPDRLREGAGEKPQRPSARGHLAGRSEGGNASKGSAYGSQKGPPRGGDVSGNEHVGHAEVVESPEEERGESAATERHEHEHDHADSHDHDHAHTHYHEDTHIHLHPAAMASEATGAMHQNPHSGFQRPPMSQGGVVPMYSASQQGITMNDSHPAGGAGLGSDRGKSAAGQTRGRSNPVKKGRG